MALSRLTKERLAKNSLNITEEKLSLFNAIVEKVGGLDEFKKAMNLWQFKGQKEMVENVVSPEELANMFSYDEDGNLYLKKNSRRKKAGDKVGSLTRTGYITTSITFDGYVFSTNLNKIIFCLHNGRWAKKGYKVDHINGITTDNRPCNLRESTNSQNGGNRKLSKNSSTGLKGVRIRYYSGKRGRRGLYLYACVDCNRKRYYKSFAVERQSLEITIQKAKAWRDEKSKELFGEFHRSS
jgi:hypothetical protein